MFIKLFFKKTVEEGTLPPFAGSIFAEVKFYSLSFGVEGVGAGAMGGAD